jgi:hypothetical protein
LRDKPIIRRHRFSDLMTNQEAGWREYPTRKNRENRKKTLAEWFKKQ